LLKQGAGNPWFGISLSKATLDAAAAVNSKKLWVYYADSKKLV